MLAIATRLVAALALGGKLYFADEAVYLDAARRLLAGEGYAAAYANVPAYPVILAALAAPWPASVLLVRCAQALVAGAGAALLVALGTAVVGAPAALVAAFLYAIDPLLAVTSGLLYPETIAAMVLTAAVLAVWVAARDDRLAAAALAGVLLAIMVQCRPVAFVLLPLLALWIAATAAGSATRRALHAATLVACCLVALAPWAARNERVHGSLVPADTPGVRGAPVAKAEIADRGLAAAVLRRTWQDPLAVVSHVGFEFGHFWEFYPTRLATDDPVHRAQLHDADPRLPSTPSFPTALRDWASALSFGVELALALVGLGVTWRRQRIAATLLLGVPLAYALGYALFVAKLRYRISVMPCVLLFAGAGVTTLARPLLGRWRGPART